MKNMLDFMYHGEYQAQTSETTTKLDVLAHLFCYAIGESYLAKKLSDYALTRFGEALRAVTPNDFAELVGVIASSTDAAPVHNSLRNTAFYRVDELAGSKSFMNIIGGKHLAITLEQKDDDGGEAVYRNLQAAIQHATFSANMLRIANLTKTRTAWENARLLRKLEDTQETVDLFRSQVIKASSSLRKFEDVNGTATDAIMAAQKETQQVKKELSKATSHSFLLLEDLNSTKSKLAEVEEQAASTAKALENAELELDILENENRNDRQALEKLSKSTAAADGLAARGQAEVNQMVSTLRGQQKSASRTEQKAIEERTRAVEEQERYTNLQSQLQGKYEQNKRQLDEANQEVQRLLAENKTIRDQDKENSTATIHPAQDELSQAKRELAEAVQVTQRVLAENQVLREQAKEIPASSPNQAVQQQRDNAMLEIREELSQAKSELSRVNEGTQRLMAETKTLREQSETNSAVMLNQAPPNRPPNEQLVFQEKSFHAQQMNTLHYHIEHLKALQIDLNRANLRNFTMQRTINDLKTIIANGAAGGLTAPGF
jgi:hypothetical protein